MKIRLKLTILLVIIISFMITVLIIYNGYVNNNLAILFHDEQKDKDAIFEKLIQLKRQAVVGIISNFTYRDNMVRFVTTSQDESWIADNIDTALKDFDANSIWIYKINTNLVYSVNNLKDDTIKTIPIPEEAFHRLFAQSRFCYFHILTQKGIMEISGATIHPSSDNQRKTAPRGYFFVGHLLDKAYINELSGLIGGEVSLFLASNKAKVHRADGGAFNKGSNPCSSTLCHNNQEMKPKKGGLISFTRELKSWNDTPLASIDVTMRSSLVYHFSLILEKIFLYLIIFSLLMAFVTVFYFISWISLPLRSISRTLRTEDVNFISSLQKHQNEFGDVARLIFVFFSQKEELTKEIADRKRAEEELRESNSRLEETLDKLKTTQHRIASQQERLGVLGQLTSGIAHDFNNALTPILGYSDMMLTDTKILNDKEKVERHLKYINIAAKNAREIVDRLREFYRNREENDIFTSVDFNELILQTIQLTKPKWKEQAQAQNKNINIVTDLQKILPVNGDEAALRDILTNLIFNAVDAITTDGAVTLHTRTDDGRVIFEISDTGIGMSEETKRRCFEAFFTTKGEHGTGLGLLTVYNIIQRHNGTIGIKSEIGKGTTFIIQLPVLEKEQDHKVDQQVEKIAESLHVLVVDDEPFVRDILGEFLSFDGHTFELASNGDEALEKFESGNFDFVITDRAMPDISGDQLASMIKKIAPNTIIIMITGFGNIMKASNEIPDNIDFLLSKPITLSEFKKLLKDVVDSSLA